LTLTNKFYTQINYRPAYIILVAVAKFLTNTKRKPQMNATFVENRK